ncbi:MAG: hypothetical protein O6945_03665, partial [Gammaproteobacteria bacterium]|nr:hypothetical protein [Gammaproteobacteria bacterium]
LLFGCATSTGVIPTGPDTYTITTDNKVGAGVAAIKIRAIQDAKAYCASSGKKMKPVTTNLSRQKNFVGNKTLTYKFTFRCLATGDED